MSWLPVMFLCLTSGDCGFVYEKATASELACVQAVTKMASNYEKIPNFKGLSATCIPLKYQAI